MLGIKNRISTRALQEQLFHNKNSTAISGGARYSHQVSLLGIQTFGLRIAFPFVPKESNPSRALMKPAAS